MTKGKGGEPPTDFESARQKRDEKKIREKKERDDDLHRKVKGNARLRRGANKKTSIKLDVKSPDGTPAVTMKLGDDDS